MLLKDWLRLTGPEYPISTAFTFIFLIISVNEAFVYDWNMLLTFVAYTLMLTGTTAHTNVMDAELDRINKPNRPIPAGRISIKSAETFALVQIAASFVLGLYISLLIAIILASFLAFIWVYNHQKLMKGFVLASSIFGIVFYFIIPAYLVFAIYRVDDISTVPLYVFFCTLFFFIGSVKDIEDVEGERQLGIDSTFNKFGQRKAMMFIIIGICISYVFLIVTFFMNCLDDSFLIPIIVSLISFIPLAVYLRKGFSLGKDIMTQSSIVSVCMLYIVANEMLFAWFIILG